MEVPEDAETFSVLADYATNDVEHNTVFIAPEGKILEVSGGMPGVGTDDTLFLYDVTKENSNLLMKTTPKDNIGRAVSSGRILVLCYKQKKGSPIYNAPRLKTGSTPILKAPVSCSGNCSTLDFRINVVDPNQEHSVSIADHESHGTITVSPNSGTIQTPVSITLTPENGYLLDYFEVNDKYGISLPIQGGTWYSGNTISFNMPGTDVTAKPTYTSSVSAEDGLTIIMSEEDAVYANIPANITSFVVQSPYTVENFHFSEPLVISAPDGYLLQLSGDYDGINFGFFAFDGEVTEYANQEFGSWNKRPINGNTSTSSTMTLYHVPGDNAEFKAIVNLIKADTEHSVLTSIHESGSLTGEISKAVAGTQVKMTANPSDGFILYSVNVTNNNGEAIPVEGGTWYSGNEFSFTMPNEDVEISVDFESDIAYESEGLLVQMPKSGTDTIIIPEYAETFGIFDDWNSQFDFHNSTLVLIAPEGAKINLSGSIEFQQQSDFLALFDGGDANATTIYSSTNNDATVNVTSSGNKLTIRYNSVYSKKAMNLIAAVINPNKKHKINTYIYDGKISVPDSALAGDSVIATVTPDAGFMLKEAKLWIRSDQSRKSIEALWYNNTIRFVMPYSDVTVMPSLDYAANAEANITIPESGSLKANIPAGLASINIQTKNPYSGNRDGILVLTAPEDYALSIIDAYIGLYDEENNALIVYDGASVNDPILKKTPEHDFIGLRSTGNKLALQFKSDATGQASRAALKVELIHKDGKRSIVVNNLNNNGQITCDKTWAMPGDTVTVTATPNNGYYFSFATVSQNNNYNMEVEDGAWYNNAVKFVMPNANVTVSAYFQKLSQGTPEVVIPVKGIQTIDVPDELNRIAVFSATDNDNMTFNNNDGYAVFTAPQGYIFKIEVHGPVGEGDSLIVYDGENANASKLSVLDSKEDKLAWSSGNKVAVRFKTDETGTIEWGGECYITLAKVTDSNAAITFVSVDNGTAVLNGSYNGVDPVNIPEDMTVQYVALNRLFTPNAYSTLSVPFKFQTAAIQGLDEVLVFNGVVEVEGKKRVEMRKVWCNNDGDGCPETDKELTYLEAYTPYIVKTSSANLNFGASPVTLKKTADATVTEGYWQFHETNAYKKWSKDDPELGTIYGFAAEEKNKAKIGEFVKAGAGAYIKPFRAYLKYSPSVLNYAPSFTGAPQAKPETELPAEMDVVIVGSTKNGKGETTKVIGRINTRTGIFSPAKTYDLKGRTLNGKPKAKGVFLEKR